MPIEAWAGIGVVIAWCIFMTLKTIAEELSYQLRLRQLHVDASNIREGINRRLLAAGLAVPPTPAAAKTEFVQEVALAADDSAALSKAA